VRPTSASDTEKVAHEVPRMKSRHSSGTDSESAFPSGQRQIARAAGVVMAAFVLSHGLGLLRDMIIARQFGTSQELGAYLAAFRVPDLIFYLIAGGALGSAFLPTFASYLAKGRVDTAWQLANAIYTWLLLILTGLAIIATWLAPDLARLIVPGFDPQAQALTAWLMRRMLIATVIFGLSGVNMGALNAHQHFLWPALAPAVYNLAIIAAAWWGAPRWGVHSLAAGVVVGAAGHWAVQIPALIRRGWFFKPRLDWRSDGIREVGRLMLPRVVGLAAVQLNFLVNTILASGLGEQAIAALDFAWKLMLLPQGVLALAVATAAFPTFSTLAAQNRFGEMRSTVMDTLQGILYLTIPAGVGLLVLRVPIIQVMLQRGLFDQSSTRSVAWALQFYALGLIAHAGVEILARAFYAMHDTRTPVAIALATMAGNIALSLILRGPLAHGGLALANSLVMFGELGALLWAIRRRLEGLEGDRFLPACLRMIVSATMMGLALVLVSGRIGDNPLLVLGISLALGVVVYGGASWALSADDVRFIWGLIRPGHRGDDT
jgi:putative peptidoglycan lipid II flippase